MATSYHKILLHDNTVLLPIFSYQCSDNVQANSSNCDLPAVGSFLKLFDGITPPPQSFNICGNLVVVRCPYLRPYTLAIAYNAMNCGPETIQLTSHQGN